MPVDVKVGEPHGSFIAQILLCDLKCKFGISADLALGAVFREKLAKYGGVEYLGGAFIQQTPVCISVYAVTVMLVAY